MTSSPVLIETFQLLCVRRGVIINIWDVVVQIKLNNYVEQ